MDLPVQDFSSRYYWARAISPLRCCGCFSNRLGSGVACLIWAALSFYFAVLAFMSRSPFYSHLDDVPLIVFGVINLIFGCITLAGFVIILVLTPRYVRVRIMVYIIGIGVVMVLVDMLVNFILFAANQDGFQSWCIDHSKMIVQNSLQQQGGGGNDNLNLPSDMDYYNCDRLFANQMKWSLLSVFAMFLVYIHWMLVITAFAGTSFFLIPPRVAAPPPPPPPATVGPPPSDMAVPGTEVLGNLPPSTKSYRGVRPFRKKTDASILAMLGLKINDSGRIIHIADEHNLPYYEDRPPRDSSKYYYADAYSKEGLL
ncbi:predicted protein [Lichtheimia corymbifera JMRC:FSU:9682]|uniref:Uncharacterized protein n=1 Tax=Lichtheimia corymbifera JMRC:FSU:9682 TaxID=1263082 RepID=A0A068RWL4_9FUNG|nr:predicted protein [Lichtheimia corymbifera JMRC:FSU:9682]